MLTINTNISSLTAQYNTDKTQNQLTTSIERLSSDCPSTAPRMTRRGWRSPTG